MGVLEKHSTTGNFDRSKKEVKKENKELVKQLYDYSKKLYAENKQSLLLIFQGMDAAGKDGLTRSMFKKCSPSWVNAQPFKKPSEEEAAHDFLWRVHKAVPQKGMITVFNRSHYEDILVPSVYGYLDKYTINKRYEQINAFEQYLEANNIKMLKFYLNVSYEKQEEKLNERIHKPHKHWKHSDGDWETRKHWNEFMEVYERIFEQCDTIPWHIIPSDKNWAKLNTAIKIVLDTLEEMNPQFPELESELFTR